MPCFIDVDKEIKHLGLIVSFCLTTHPEINNEASQLPSARGVLVGEAFRTFRTFPSVAIVAQYNENTGILAPPHHGEPTEN